MASRCCGIFWRSESVSLNLTLSHPNSRVTDPTTMEATHRKGLPRSGFPLRMPAGLRYLFVIGFSVGALALTHSADNLESEHFYLYLLLGVLASAWVGGWVAGVLASAITAAGAFLWMYHPTHGGQDAIRLATFIATCSLLCWLSQVIESRRKTQISLHEDEERLRLAVKAGDAWTWEWDP